MLTGRGQFVGCAPSTVHMEGVGVQTVSQSHFERKLCGTRHSSIGYNVNLVRDLKSNGDLWRSDRSLCTMSGLMETFCR